METDLLYSDALVSISEGEIVFKEYYFPTGRSKVVRWGDIESIWVEQPTFWNGKWRTGGTGTFLTWYPMDGNRSGRDRIFFARLKTQWIKIGFTVEDGERVEEIVRAKGVMR